MRFLKIFKELWLLDKSIISALKTLMWVLSFFFFLCIYMFGLGSKLVLLDGPAPPGDDDFPVLEE